MSLILYFVEYVDDNDDNDEINNEDLNYINSLIEERQEDEDAFIRWKRIQIRKNNHFADKDNSNDI